MRPAVAAPCAAYVPDVRTGDVHRAGAHVDCVATRVVDGGNV